MLASSDLMALPPFAEDNVDFITHAQRALRSVMAGYRHESIRIVRINNWFGSRWLAFSGKLMGGVGVCKWRLTVPPFVPGRVVDESLWGRVNDAHYKSLEGFRPLHRSMGSEENTRRYLDLECPNSITVWVSGRSEINRRGSIMVYVTGENRKTDSWYVELSEERQWQPTKAIGITRKEFGMLVNL